MLCHLPKSTIVTHQLEWVSGKNTKDLSRDASGQEQTRGRVRAQSEAMTALNNHQMCLKFGGKKNPEKDKQAYEGESVWYALHGTHN